MKLSNLIHCPHCGFKNNKKYTCENCNLPLKNRYSFIFLILSLPLLCYGSLLLVKPCYFLPLKITIGKIDPEYNVSSDFAQAEIIKSINKWNDALNRKLFVYDSNSRIKINFVYDKDNPAFKKYSELSILNQRWNDIEKQKIDYEKMNNVLSSDFNKYYDDLEKYNANVDYWNNLGGMPEPYYSRSLKQSVKLDIQYAELSQRQKELESLNNKLTISVAEYNKDSSDFNSFYSQSDIKIGINKVSYFDRSIEIYAIPNTDIELTSLITHELGHFFTKSHAIDIKAIMYPSIGPMQGEIQSEDIALVCKFCRF